MAPTGAWAGHLVHLTCGVLVAGNHISVLQLQRAAVAAICTSYFRP